MPETFNLLTGRATEDDVQALNERNDAGNDVAKEVRVCLKKAHSQVGKAMRARGAALDDEKPQKRSRKPCLDTSRNVHTSFGLRKS